MRSDPRRVGRVNGRVNGCDDGRGGLRDELGGQMMLLAAIVMVIGFIALSGMLARVSQLSSETLREQDDPVLGEMDVVARSLATLLNATVEENAGCSTDTVTNLTAVMDQVVRLENSRGYFMNYTALSCSSAGSTDTASVRFSLTDGWTRVSLTVVAEFTHS